MESTPAIPRARAHSASNLCMGGRLVPELYVIGAHKAGTTSLADELMRSEQLVLQRETYGGIGKTAVEWIDIDEDGFQSSKEPHFFDWRYHRGKQAWFSLWPRCQHDHRQVAVDMTPQVHFTVVASRIAEYYGALRSRLKLVALLRNPLERLHSAFFFQAKNMRRSQVKYLSMGNLSFPEYIQKTVLNPPACSQIKEPRQADMDPFCDSLYADQLRGWFSIIDAAQFTIYPMQSIMEPGLGEPSAAESLLGELGIRGSPLPETPRSNVGDHGALLDDLDGNSTLMTEITRLLESRTGADKVASVLASYRPNLYKFVGDSTDKKAVGEWLRAKW